MSYIGVQKSNHLSPSFVKESFTGTGGTATFTLTNPVPGGNPDNILVVVNNVIQEPVVAYSIGDSGNSPVLLTFTSTPANGDSIYVIHRGIGTLSRVPVAGSVGLTELEDGLKSFTIDTFSGDNTAYEFPLSKTPPSASAILVFVDGIYQKLTTNYTVSGSTLSFGSGNQPATGTEIEVIHLGILTGSQRVPDNSIESAMLQDDAVTTAKIADNAITINQMGDDSVGTQELTPNLNLTGTFKVGTNSLVVDSSENIGIGTTPKSHHANWSAIDIGDQGGLAHYDGGATSLSTNLYHDGSWRAKETGTSSRLEMGADGIVNLYTGASASADANVSLTNTVTVETSGDVNVKAGNLKIGTAGKGIDFSATSDASGMTSELLDDYEEGTFSVVFRDGSGGSGNDSQTFSGQTYVKIGNVVHCNIFCENITTTGMGVSNDIYMHGLPFVPNRTSYTNVWTSHVTYLGETISFVATNGVTHGYFSALKSGIAAETMDTYHFGSQNNTADVGMHLTYFTDS